MHSRPSRAAGDAGSPVADDDKTIDDPGGRRTDTLVAGVALGAQLEHLAEDGDPPTGQAGQQLEGRLDRRG